RSGSGHTAGRRQTVDGAPAAPTRRARQARRNHRRAGGDVRTKTRLRLTTVTAALFLTLAGSAAVTSGARAGASPQIRPAAAVPNTAYVQIKNRAWGQCVDAPDGGFNVHLRLADCDNGKPTQHWVLVPTGAANFFIVNQASGYCMEVNNGTSNPTEPVD